MKLSPPPQFNFFSYQNPIVQAQIKYQTQTKHQTQISQTKFSIKPSYQTYQTQINRKSAQQSQAIATTHNPLIKQTHDPACHHQKSKQNKVGLIQIPNFERERETEFTPACHVNLAALTRHVNHHHPHYSTLTELVMEF